MGPIWVRVARLFYETVGVSFHLQNSAMTAGRIRRGRRMAASGCLLPQGLVQQGYSPRFPFGKTKEKRGCICPASSITARPASNGTHPILHRQQTWRPLSLRRIRKMCQPPPEAGIPPLLTVVGRHGPDGN